MNVTLTKGEHTKEGNRKLFPIVYLEIFSKEQNGESKTANFMFRFITYKLLYKLRKFNIVEAPIDRPQT